MKLLIPIAVHLLVAAGSRPKVKHTWYVDGNNLLGHKGTPKDPEALTQKLQLIQGVEEVILVLDGRPNTETEIIDCGGGSNLKRVNLGQGLSADDWILQDIGERNQANAPRRDQTTRVQVVTADRKLRQRIRNIKPVVKDVVNPVTFWKRYLPRMCGFKLPKGGDVEHQRSSS